MKYRAYGLDIASDEPIAELNGVEFDEADACTRVSIERVPHVPPLPEPDATPPPMPELRWPVILRDLSGYRLRFSEDSDFWLAAHGRTIRLHRGVPASATDRHYLLDHVLPRALDLLGRNPLHATAVATTQGVLAFLGATGTGKSTVAAALVAHGCELVSDDCLVLEQRQGAIVAVPSYPGLRLYDDAREVLEFDTGLQPVAAYTPKQRVTAGVPLATEARPLRAVHVLSRHDRVTRFERPEIVPLGPADALMALTGSAFRMDVERREQHRQQLAFFAQVVRSVPIYRCTFGSNLPNVAKLAETLLKDLATSNG